MMPNLYYRVYFVLAVSNVWFYIYYIQYTYDDEILCTKMWENNIRYKTTYNALDVGCKYKYRSNIEWLLYCQFWCCELHDGVAYCI